MIAEPNIPAAGSFPSLRVAEGVISDAVKGRAPAIEAWAKTAGPSSKYIWVHYASKTIGYGVVRQTGRLTDMYKLRIVLRPTLVQGRLYYILTAYPIP